MAGDETIPRARKGKPSAHTAPGKPSAHIAPVSTLFTQTKFHAVYNGLRDLDPPLQSLPFLLVFQVTMEMA